LRLFSSARRTQTPHIDALSLHDALPISSLRAAGVEPSQVTDIFISHRHADHVGGLLAADGAPAFPNATVHLTTAEWAGIQADARSEEHTSELQSRENLVCRLLLEKKKKK